MSGIEQDRRNITTFAELVKSLGYRVFVAERGTYGFYTDEEGSRVVRFQADWATIHLNGNYRTDQPQKTGTGWSIEDVEVNQMRKYIPAIREALTASPPSWAVGSAKWRFATIKEHLDLYGKSSKYQEV